MLDCIFCKIVAGQIPSCKVFENAAALAFMDINPLAPGHVLVIPKSHYERLTEMSDDACAEVGRLLPAISRAVVAATKAEGFNLYQTNGACAGQVVGHVHFHIIPRNSGDGLGYRWAPRKYGEGDMEKYRSLIANQLSAVS